MPSVIRWKICKWVGYIRSVWQTACDGKLHAWRGKWNTWWSSWLNFVLQVCAAERQYNPELAAFLRNRPRDFVQHIQSCWTDVSQEHTWRQRGAAERPAVPCHQQRHGQHVPSIARWAGRVSVMTGPVITDHANTCWQFYSTAWRHGLTCVGRIGTAHSSLRHSGRCLVMCTDMIDSISGCIVSL